MANVFRLDGKNIIVTGASSGIGKQCAIECSKQGANVVLIGRNTNRLQQTFGELMGENHLYYKQDLTDFDSIADVVTDVVSRLGAINGLIHSAGIELVLPLKLLTHKHYEKVFSINVIAGYEIAKQVTKKKFFSENGGSLVFIASVTGIKGEAVKLAYSSSKAAVINGVKSLALELASRKIRVNALSPAVCETQMSRAFLDKLSPEANEAIIKKHPLGLGQTDDIAYGCIYLLSDASRWVTGTNLVIDGGFSAA